MWFITQLTTKMNVFEGLDLANEIQARVSSCLFMKQMFNKTNCGIVTNKVNVDHFNPHFVDENNPSKVMDSFL